MDLMDFKEDKPLILVNGHFYLSYDVFVKINLNRLTCWHSSNNDLLTYTGLLSQDQYSLFVIQESSFSIDIDFSNGEHYMISERLNHAKVSFVENDMILTNRSNHKKVIEFAIITKDAKWYFCGNFCYVEEGDKKFCLFQN